MPDKKFPPELESLLRANRAGTITPEEQQRLEMYLKTNDAALEHYLSLCEIDGLIAPESAEEKIIPFTAAPRRTLAFAAGIAASVLLVAGGIFYAHRQPAIPATDAPYCKIANAFGASFKNAQVSADIAPQNNLVEIDTGVVEILFAQGARTILEAPAALEITGPNSCKLRYGKAVADVPPSALGFTMDSPHNRIVDYGTRFAVDASPGKQSTFVGVISGMVDVEHGNQKVRLYTNYAIEQSTGSPVSVPLNRDEFLAEMPQREFSWNLEDARIGEARTFCFDVTQLMKIPGDEFHIIYKWLTGNHTLIAREFRLECDGEVVQTLKTNDSSTGKTKNTFGNNFIFKIPPVPAAGKEWKMYVDVVCGYDYEYIEGQLAKSRGIFLFEKNLLKNTSCADFVGRWEYSHNGFDFVRECLPDGGWRLFINGKEFIGPGVTGRCTIENGVLTMPFTRVGQLPEKVMLLDKNTLIFLNRPYRNAVRAR